MESKPEEVQTDVKETTDKKSKGKGQGDSTRKGGKDRRSGGRRNRRGDRKDGKDGEDDDRRGGRRGDRRRGGDRRGGKGEGRSPGKKERERRPRKEREPIPEVTLETVIPDMPTKEEKLSKPNNKEKFEILDKLDDEIDKIVDTRRKFFQDLAAKNRATKGEQDHQSNDIVELGKLQNKAREQIRRGFDTFNKAGGLKQQKSELNQQLTGLQTNSAKHEKKLIQGFMKTDRITSQLK